MHLQRIKNKQKGAYAIEFALVFPLFFIILYGIISYGILLILNLSLQYAAEEGARAALRHQSSPETRKSQAVSVSLAQLSWIKADYWPQQSDVFPRICKTGSDCTVDATDCNDSLDKACQINITIKYNYKAHPIAPPLPIFLMPDTLTGSASAIFEGQ